MDATQIRQLQPKLRRYLQQFRDCFSSCKSRAHLHTYVQGQLSNLDRKSVEPIALAADVPPRTLQQFLNSLAWDQEQLVDTLQGLVARDHPSPRAIGLIDETSCPKKGDQTPGVQRQWCGAAGKTDNCVVTVHLGYAVDEFHCLLDSELYLPKGWTQDRARCRQASIPDEIDYRPKWRMALELLDRARDNGLSFRYLVFDEGYGSKPEFLRELQTREQCYVAEVPRTFRGWLAAPPVTERRFRRGGRGRGRTRPRLVAGSAVAQGVEYHLNWTPALKAQSWSKWRIKDTQRGPLVWQVKHVRLVPKDERDLPGPPLHLIVACNVLDPTEVKYFVSNAPADTPLHELLLVAFSRWHIERCFEDQKTELGFDHFEGRSYLGLKRHQAVTAVSHLFLAQVQQELRGEKPGTDGVPGAYRGSGCRTLLVARQKGRPGPVRGRGHADCLLPTTQRRRPPQPHQDNPAKTPCIRHQTDRLAAVSVEGGLALSYYLHYPVSKGAHKSYGANGWNALSWQLSVDDFSFITEVHMYPRDIRVESPQEALIVEQALAMYRELRQAAAQAPDGVVLSVAESLALARGRELTRQSLEAVLQEEIEAGEKKGRRPARAPAEAAASIGAGKRGGSLPRAAR